MVPVSMIGLSLKAMMYAMPTTVPVSYTHLPTVWRIAAALNLRGEVFNDPQGVGVRLEGDPQALDAFPAALRRECPPLARIDTLEVFPTETVGFTDFRIVKSETCLLYTSRCV